MRWLKALLVLLVVLILGVAAFVTFLVRRSFPEVDGEIAVAGLLAEVEIVRDDLGVPHIYASNSHDLFFAQGYTHAQERFWQMDFWRHIGSARLAEMFGEDQVGTDRFLRSLGFTELAEHEYTALSPKARDVLDSYAEGVNAYLAEHDGSEVSLEYGILPLQNSGYEIEPWSPINTLTWAKVMSWDLSDNMGAEISRAVLAKTLGTEDVEALFPPYPEDHPVIVPDDQVGAANGAPITLADEAMPPLLSAAQNAAGLSALTGGGFDGIGSNNWVVSGDLTESGLPLLANDTHLAIQMPSIWFANGLHCVGDDDECPYQLVGFSFAGTPGVIIGHNDRIAWGVTTEALDTQDLFIERVNPDDPGQYEVDGEWVDFETRSETIEVAGGDTLTFDVLSTRHGPVISYTYLDDGLFDGSAAIELPDEYVVALRWQTLEPSTLLEAILQLDTARDYDDFRAAMALWDIAAQNVIYADVEGNIAYQSTGEVPIRSAGDGRSPVPGWSSHYEWVGLVPYDEMPLMFNPPRGFIESANQFVQRPGTGPFLSSDSNTGYRGARIESLIEQLAPHTVETMQTMQFDSFDGGAAAVVPYLLSVPSAGNEAVEDIQARLESWSTGEEAFQARGDSNGAAIYEAVWRRILAETFHDELVDNEWPYGGDRWFEVVVAILADPASEWWDDIDTTGVEDRDDILFQSMIAAYDDLAAELGDEADDWTWGGVHIAEFENQTFGQSGIGPIEWLFNRTAPHRVGGSESVVNAVGWNTALGYRVDWLPSERMVVDLADLAASTFIHTTGQSGHAFHPHYDDMIESWSDGEQAPMRWDEADTRDEAASTLRLSPADD